MNWIKYILIFIVFLIVGFLIMGLLNDEFESAYELEISASPEVVKQAMLDTAAIQAWMYGLYKVEALEGNRSQAGDLSRLSFRNEDGRVMTVKESLENKGQNALSWLWDHEKFRLQFDYELVPKGEGTLLKMKLKGKAHSIFFRSMFAFMKSGITEGQKGNLERLKKYCE